MEDNEDPFSNQSDEERYTAIFKDASLLEGASNRIDEAELYNIVSNELKDNIKDSGLWLQALTLTEGLLETEEKSDEEPQNRILSKAEITYIKLKVQNLKDKQIMAIAESSKKQVEELKKRQAEEENKKSNLRNRAEAVKWKAALKALKKKDYDVTYSISKNGAIKKERLTFDKLIEYSKDPSKI